MGIVRMGPPEEAVVLVKNSFDVKTFVETGTYKGETTLWAANNFDKVLTIEFSSEIFETTSKKLSTQENIDALYGDSRVLLRKIIDEQTEPYLFWLDAHWSDGITYGEEDQCPLMEELGIIRSSKFTNFLFIDDARLFLSPPPLPNVIHYYPTISEIIGELDNYDEDMYTVVYEDAIISIPGTAKSEFSKFLQNSNTEKWNRRKTLQNEGKLKKTLRSLYDTFKLWI
ncbi:hypothetical protein FNH22_18475 [Fulvivirga sp. M361]|uniref:hypothetical protein n=1 Tax=Fulvivirga sp. M361 TaxID=2594266 RepID=UPI00117ACB49|nr:hypothetical protein [Fulvivirga sp. M361]TRX55612.1 hypothetical protein FNH22_18475 [Fulvivirga sp. M361]